MNSITPVWYWRVNHEYIDFIHSTIKRMTMVELNETPGLFDAQRRCSDLNSAVYKYYDNIKKRCLSGEKSRMPIWMCLTYASASGSSVWRLILRLSRWCGRNFNVQRSKRKRCEGIGWPCYVPWRLTLLPGTELQTAICQMRPATGSVYHPRHAYQSAPVLRR